MKTIKKFWLALILSLLCSGAARAGVVYVVTNGPSYLCDGLMQGSYFYASTPAPGTTNYVEQNGYETLSISSNACVFFRTADNRPEFLLASNNPVGAGPLNGGNLYGVSSTNWYWDTLLTTVNVNPPWVLRLVQTTVDYTGPIVFQVSGAGVAAINTSFLFSGTANGWTVWSATNNPNLTLQTNAVSSQILRHGNLLYYAPTNNPFVARWLLGPGGLAPLPVINQVLTVIQTNAVPVTSNNVPVIGGIGVTIPQLPLTNVINDTDVFPLSSTAGATNARSVTAATMAAKFGGGGGGFTNYCPVDTSFNFKAWPTPLIGWDTWGSSGAAESGITNTLKFIGTYLSNAVTFISLDEGCAVTRTNGILGWASSSQSGTNPATGQLYPFPYYGALPDGIPFIIKYAHTNGVKALVWIDRYAYNNFSTMSNGYIGTPLTNVVSDFTTILKTWGADGLVIDHVPDGIATTTYTPPQTSQYEQQWAALAYNTISTLMASTNAAANNVNAVPYNQWMFLVYGISDLPCWHWAGALGAPSDLMLNANAPAGWSGLPPSGIPGYNPGDLLVPRWNGATNAPAFLSAQAETNYQIYVSAITNISTVKVECLNFDTGTPAFDMTNSLNIIITEGQSFMLQGSNGNSTNQNSFLWTAEPIVQALRSANGAPNELVQLHRALAYNGTQPIIGLPVTNWPNADGSTTEVWSRQLPQPYKYEFMVWNHSVTLASTNTLSFASISATLGGTVVLHSPWLQADILTNGSGAVSFTNTAAQITLFTVQGNIAPSGISLAGLTRSVAGLGNVTATSTVQGDGTTNTTLIATNIVVADQKEFLLTPLIPNTQGVALGNYWMGPIIANSGTSTEYYSPVPYLGKTNFTLTVNLASVAAGSNILQFTLDVMGITNATQRQVSVYWVTNGAIPTNLVYTFSGNLSTNTTPTPITLQPCLTALNGGNNSYYIGWAKLLMY